MRLIRFLAARPVLTTGVLAFCIRLLALWQLPIFITNDGSGYVEYAQSIASGTWPDMPSFRTPGYPLFLAAVFFIEESPLLVQAFQHVLGVITVCAATMALVRLGRPRAALLIGILLALDPRALTFETAMLSETLTTTLVTCAGALCLWNRKPSVWRVISVAALLALACLVRPAVQLILPFFVFAAALGDQLKPTILRFIVGCVISAALVTPWLIYNASRGIVGLNGSGPVYLWYGLAFHGMLDEDAMPERFADDYASTIAGHPGNVDRMFAFIQSQNAWEDKDVHHAMRAWSIRTIRRHPMGYAVGVVKSAFWQMDTPICGVFHEVNWFVRSHQLRRRSQEHYHDNLATPDSPHLERMRITRKAGPLAEVTAQWSKLRYAGVVTLTFYIVMTAVAVMSLRSDRRHSLMALGCLALLAVHALYLLPYSRYTMSAWPIIAVLAVPAARKALAGEVQAEASEAS